MNSAAVTSVTTALWILIELIQFAYMAYMIWRSRNVNNRHSQRVRAAFTYA